MTDVGFGKFANSPLKYALNVHQNDKNEIFCFEKYDEEYFIVNKLESDKIIPQYIFKPIAKELQDFMGMCEYHQTCIDCYFTRNKIISIATNNGRKTLTNNKIKSSNNEKEDEFLVLDENEFNKQLWEHFNIRI